MIRTLLVVAVLVAIILVVRTRRGNEPSTTTQATAAIGSLEADQQTLRALRDAGANLTKPTEVNFYLYFHERAAADSAAAQAGTQELTASVQRAADNSAWLCLVTGTIVPSETAIRQASSRLQAVAATHGGEYDGWEAAVTK
jgi:hypothetical protein